MCTNIIGNCSQMYSQSRSSRVRGKFLVLPSPGSDVVLDRNSNTLVPCDDLTCPFADLEGDPPDPSAPSKLFVNYTRLLGLNETTKAVLVRRVHDAQGSRYCTPLRTLSSCMHKS